jgi:hypothetical protein
LTMRMRVCYLDCHEYGLCCYTETLLRPLQLFYFHLWHTYWLSLIENKKSYIGKIKLYSDICMSVHSGKRTELISWYLRVLSARSALRNWEQNGSSFKACFSFSPSVLHF